MGQRITVQAAGEIGPYCSRASSLNFRHNSVDTSQEQEYDRIRKFRRIGNIRADLSEFEWQGLTTCTKLSAAAFPDLWTGGISICNYCLGRNDTRHFGGIVLGCMNPILQVNAHWLALDEIFKIYKLLHRSKLKIAKL